MRNGVSINTTRDARGHKGPGKDHKGPQGIAKDHKEPG